MGGAAVITRAELALVLLVLFVVAFLFWSRNVVVRTPGITTPISAAVGQLSSAARVNQEWTRALNMDTAIGFVM